jgi:hypothetical protein
LWPISAPTPTLHAAHLCRPGRERASNDIGAHQASAGIGEANGKQLGGLCDYGRAAKADAIERAKALAPLFDELADKSAREMARILNERNVATPTGKPWPAMTVIRAIDCGLLPEPR